MMPVRKGLEEGLPYSISRWTDVPGTDVKWEWFRAQLERGWMVGFDPRTFIPARWSLAPADVLGTIFWTKDPHNLVLHPDLIRPLNPVVHVTINSWPEAEQWVPPANRVMDDVGSLMDLFGPDRVVWRFSPVPMLRQDALLQRFSSLASRAAAFGLRRVYVCFLQENDNMPEGRTSEERRRLLGLMADAAGPVRILLCRDDHTLEGVPDLPGLAKGVCEDGSVFGLERGTRDRDACGCIPAVDPFAATEQCGFGCRYCYSADVRLTPIRRNTTT